MAARLEKVALALWATRKGSYEELSESELVYGERSKGRNKDDGGKKLHLRYMQERRQLGDADTKRV